MFHSAATQTEREIMIASGLHTDLLPLLAHPLRDQVLAEAHARPFEAMQAPCRLLHFAFVTDAVEALADRAALTAFCGSLGEALPGPLAKHHRLTLPEGSLRWEQHSEFTTYTWEFRGGDILGADASALSAAMLLRPQPGGLLVAVDLKLIDDAAMTSLEEIFDPSVSAMSHMDGGAALVATDFKPDAAGFVRIIVVNQRLPAHRAGALAQRLLELETYRVLALLSLPEAQRLAPNVRNIELELPEITRGIDSETASPNRELLDRLISMAARLEADTTPALYRFGASRAYHEIVKGRLEAIDETPFPGRSTFAAFLSRRLTPAMRTCTTQEERQAALSQKLARAAQLLIAKVQIELEDQNRDLLSNMNRRTQLQLRLQQTVEGLSIAAITYYLLGIIVYVLKGLHVTAPWIQPDLAAAISAPVIFLLVAIVLHFIRREHAERV